MSAESLASHCAGIDRNLSDAESQSVAPVVASQLGIGSVQVVSSMRLGNWQILQAVTRNSDPPYVFYRSPPSQHHYVALWAGAAKADERQSVKEWAQLHAKGIPPALAECFAWHVSVEHTQ